MPIGAFISSNKIMIHCSRFEVQNAPSADRLRSSKFEFEVRSCPPLSSDLEVPRSKLSHTRLRSPKSEDKLEDRVHAQASFPLPVVVWCEALSTNISLMQSLPLWWRICFELYLVASVRQLQNQRFQVMVCSLSLIFMNACLEICGFMSATSGSGYQKVFFGKYKQKWIPDSWLGHGQYSRRCTSNCRCVWVVYGDIRTRAANKHRAPVAVSTSSRALISSASLNSSIVENLMYFFLSKSFQSR